MQTFKILTRLLILIPLALGLAACGNGGDGGTTPTPTPTPTPPITSFELLDPTPGAGDQFGERVVLLANGNIVVSDPLDSSVAPHNGAVHLYDPITQTLIASVYGDTASDLLGLSGITALANNNFVIASPFVDEGTIVDAGSVRLVNGATGDPIGNPIAGDTAFDELGSDGITALANNNFVIASPFDDEGTIVNAGSVRLVNGATGDPIGTLAGDTAFDFLGFSGITALANNNFVIASAGDDEGTP